MLNKILNWTLSAKIIFLFVFNTVVALVIIGAATYYFEEIGEELHQITSEDIPLTEAITKITAHQLEQSIHFERAARYAGLGANDSDKNNLIKKEVGKFSSLAEIVDKEILNAKI
jgi:methyl-accepting chemotaxis protein